MKLDVLITKYLDGELTLQEDAELREYIAEYPEAKEQFQEALDVHVAMKDDAATTVLPPELAIATEESVLMQILGELPDNEPEEEKKRRPIAFWWTLPTAAVLTTLVGFIIGFDVLDNASVEKASIVDNYQAVELEMPLPADIDNGYDDLSSTQPMVVAAGNALALSASLESRTVGRAFANEQSNASSNNALALADASSAAPVGLTSVDGSLGEVADQSQFAAVDADEFQAMPADVSGSGGYVSRSDFTERVQENSQTIASSVESLHSTLPITLTTTVGTELASNAADNGSVFSFASQSLAYGITDAGKVGLEAGHFSYAYNTAERVYIPEAKFDLIDGPVPGKGGDQINVLDQASEGFGAEGGQFIHLYSTKQHNSVFGAVFYEHRLYNAETFHFTTRVGLGGSSDGILTYFRAGTGYELSGSVSLNVGIDTRYLKLRVAQKSATQTNHLGVSLFGALNITI